MTIKENIKNLKITLKDLIFILPLVFAFIHRSYGAVNDARDASGEHRIQQP